MKTQETEIISIGLWGKFDGLTALRPCPITPHLTPVLLIQDETQCNLILLQQCDNNIVTVEFVYNEQACNEIRQSLEVSKIKKK